MWKEGKDGETRSDGKQRMWVQSSASEKMHFSSLRNLRFAIITFPMKSKENSLRAVSQSLFISLSFLFKARSLYSVAGCRTSEYTRRRRGRQRNPSHRTMRAYGRRTMKKAFALLRQKLFFILLQNAVFVLNTKKTPANWMKKKNMENKIKNMHCVLHSIYRIEGEGKKNYGEYRRLAAQKKTFCDGNNKKYSQ